jgi:hypothetical protein
MPSIGFTEADLTSLLRAADLPVPAYRHARLATQFATLLQGAILLNRKVQALPDVSPITQFQHIVAEEQEQA